MTTRLKKHVLESPITRLEKFRLYETATMFYLVGFNEIETAYRLIKINRTILNPQHLSEIVREDPLVYSASELSDVLDMIHEGNKTSGGLVKIATACGIVGFVKFLNGYYLILITQKREVGCIAGNFIYTIKATEMFPIKPRPEPETSAFKSFWKSLNKRISQTASEIAENRYLGLFQFVDMTKDFFFSYSYDVTHSLQYNFIAAKNGRVPPAFEMFEWNYYLINEFRSIVGEVAASQWTVPIIHGSFQQKRFTQLGSTMDLILLARRSRHYAGTRYLKRGLNVSGKVANDCEVEQILQYDEGADLKFCAYLQMRGSIPTYWHQETSVTMPKPPILINRVDPDYLATQEHFSNLFRRYGSPIIVLDLVKQHERKPRESIVGREFRNSIETLNECIWKDHKIRYVALDYSKITSISKGKFTKAKASRVGQSSGFLMGLAAKKETEKERATAAVGDEWNLMEKSLVKSAADEGSISQKGGGVETSVPAMPQTLTKFDDAKKSSAFLSSPAPANSSGVNITSLQQSSVKTAFDVIDDVSAVESRIDVLKELEDIASLSIQETGFFCNSLQFADRLTRILPGPMVSAAEPNNLLLQSGVLRTNCIDCLDRTNGGQFAVGLHFLRVALYSLGLRGHYSQNLEIHKDPLLLTLMEMYGEMADKIALQYGGSEAHKKVLAGKTVPSNNSKQNELLTSIKRYYSNAFTDMVKQDAMNIFLGCFVPGESNIPLWDLESDYHLHNVSLHPPAPPIYRIIYQDIVQSALRWKDGPLRSKIDSMIKKVVQKMITLSVAQLEDKKLLAGTGDRDSSTNGGTPESNSYKKSSSPQHATKSISLGEEEQEVTIGGIRLNIAECETILRRYYMRFVGSVVSSASVDFFPSSKNAPSGAGAQTTQPINTDGGMNSSSPINAGTTKRRKNPYNSAIQSLTRLERRRLMRYIMSQKIALSAEAWWQSAIRDYQLEHTLLMEDAPINAPSPSFARQQQVLTFCQEKDLYAHANSEDLLPKESYFSRYYRPHELTEFDSMLQMDFFMVTDISHNHLHSSGNIGAGGHSRNSLSGGHEGIALTHAGEGVSECADTVADASILSNILYYPNLLTSTVVGSVSSQANTANDDREEMAETLPKPNQPQATTRASPSSETNITVASQRVRPSAVTMNVTIPDDDPSNFPVNTPTNISTLGRYVREIGLKARTLVGGFLRKDDGSSALNTATKPHNGHRGRLPRSNSSAANITNLSSAVSKASEHLYETYAATYEDNTLLLYDHANHNVVDMAVMKDFSVHHLIYDVIAVREEYRTLLKDLTIHIDDVSNMEQLAKDAYISREVQMGVFLGLPHDYSAHLASLYLFLSLEFMQSDLLTFSNFIDSHYNRYLQQKDGAANLGHARVFSANLNGAAVHNLNLVNTVNNGMAGTLSSEGSVLGGLEFSQRREDVAKSLSVSVMNQLQDRLKKCIANQRKYHTVNYYPMNLDVARVSVEKREIIAYGLENEVKKIVNNHLFQQYVYSKEVSLDRLSLRISSYTSNSSLMDYLNQFDLDIVASNIGDVTYILRDSTQYYSGFREIQQLQLQLDGLIKSINEKKKARLQLVSKVSETQQPETSVQLNDDSSSITEKNRQERRQSYRKTRLDLLAKEQENQRFKTSCVSLNTSDSKSCDSNEKLSALRAERPASPFGVSASSSGSLSAQLGIYNAILEEDLKTDFSLELYNSYAAVDSTSAEALFYPFSAFPYNQDSYRIADRDYKGFVQLAPGLYSRSTNPHLQLNEIGVQRFQESLRRQEMAVIEKKAGGMGLVTSGPAYS